MPPNSPSEDDPNQRSRKKPRRWLRRLAVLLVLLCIFAWLLNGIIFRSIVRTQVAEVLEGFHLRGDFAVEGTLLGGLRLQDVDLKGTHLIQSLQLGSAEIDYKLLPLARGEWGEGITKIHADQMAVRIDTSRDFPTEMEIESHQKDQDSKDLRSDLWENLDSLLAQDLSLTNLDLELHHGGEDLLVIDQLSVVLKSGSGKLHVERVTYPNGQMGSNLSAELSSRGAPVIAIGAVVLTEKFSIGSLALKAPVSTGSPPTLYGEIDAFGAHLVASQASETRWKVAMESGSIDLATATEWLGKDMPVSGKIVALEATFDPERKLTTWGSFEARGVSYDGHATDHITASFAYSDDAQSTEPDKRKQLIVQPLMISKGANTVSVSGQVGLDSKDLVATVRVEAPDLSEMLENSDFSEISGSVSGGTTIQYEGGKIALSTAGFSARGIGYRGTNIGSAELNAQLEEPDTIRFKIESDLDEKNSMKASGTYQVEEQTYEANAILNLNNISNLHSALALFEIEERPRGNVKLEWSGSGDVDDVIHSGAADITDLSVRMDAADPVSGALTLSYAPDDYELSALQLNSGDLSVSGGARLSGRRLEVSELRLFNGEVSLARADISLPLDLRKVRDLDSFLDQPGEVSIQVDSKKLRLADLMALAVQEELPVAATLDAKVNIHGSLSRPVGKGSLHALQIRSGDAPELAPADAHLDFALDEGRVILDGRIEHPEIKPVTISGSSPLRLQSLDEFADQEINLNFDLPETELALAKKYVPDLTHAEGTVAATVRVTGTPESPKLGGEITASCPLLKFKAQKIPTLSDIVVAIRLHGNQINFERCHGYLAGGRFNVGGVVGFEEILNPQLDLAITAKQILVHRDESISMRANGDLKLVGPYEGATLSGKVGITQSRFFKEIEILPIGLTRSSPTPAAPRAPSFGSKREIGIAAAPFAEWQLDIKVVTDDPFLVRSNLAQGDIEVDLRVSGTGARPIPEGVVRLENGTATLPFSELETTVGTLTFSEKTGFDPEVNFRAHSKVQDYEISLIAYGRVSNPKTIISSDPPLPETEAVSLLATGVKNFDLADAEVIAGDAALLLIDKLRRKYAKGTPLERQPGDLRDLLSFKAGQVDPRTGKRAASASLEVTDNVFILGNVDVEGEYRGLVKLIFRFK